jgi:hypothetical protein
MALVRSIALSILASVAATFVARRVLSITDPRQESGSAGSAGTRTLVVVVPIFSGNSNNRIGWVKEDHHHHHRRRRFGRPHR